MRIPFQKFEKSPFPKFGIETHHIPNSFIRFFKLAYLTISAVISRSVNCPWGLVGLDTWCDQYIIIYVIAIDADKTKEPSHSSHKVFNTKPLMATKWPPSCALVYSKYIFSVNQSANVGPMFVMPMLLPRGNEMVRVLECLGIDI